MNSGRKQCFEHGAVFGLAPKIRGGRLKSPRHSIHPRELPLSLSHLMRMAARPVASGTCREWLFPLPPLAGRPNVDTTRACTFPFRALGLVPRHGRNI